MTAGGQGTLVRALAALALAVSAVLGAAAIWMGGLNQDEGWYLYAANMVAEGSVPYRDFFYTQGPIMPYVYSVFAWVWKGGGLLGARVFTLLLGAAGVVFSVALARRLVPEERRGAAGLVAFLLLGCNLYHLYYLAIPKTYALAGLFVAVGFYLLSIAAEGRRALSILAGLSLAFAAGTRISLGALMAVVGLWLLCARNWRVLVGFCVGGLGGLLLAYGPCLLDGRTLAGFLAAQSYHAERGGFDVVWTVGSFSRLVRWYLPVFIVFGLWAFGGRVGSRADDGGRARFANVLLWGFAAVFAVQMLAPFPYEDYQVPVMGLLAVASAVKFVGLVPVASNLSGRFAFFPLLLVLGMAFANSFGSPLLEKWSTNGQDRFWSLKKAKYELAQLREVADRIRALDPEGTTLLTQDLYLAVETNRKVPKGLEMGPFSMLSDEEWRLLLAHPSCNLAAMSGYTFAIEPPSCRERSVERQMEYWSILKRNYEFVERHDSFGQNSTPLLILRRK